MPDSDSLFVEWDRVGQSGTNRACPAQSEVGQDRYYSKYLSHSGDPHRSVRSGTSAVVPLLRLPALKVSSVQRFGTRAAACLRSPPSPGRSIQAAGRRIARWRRSSQQGDAFKGRGVQPLVSDLRIRLPLSAAPGGRRRHERGKPDATDAITAAWFSNVQSIDPSSARATAKRIQGRFRRFGAETMPSIEFKSVQRYLCPGCRKLVNIKPCPACAARQAAASTGGADVQREVRRTTTSAQKTRLPR